MHASPSLSVIIPTRGRPAKLAACLDALAPQLRPDDEVVVAIDGEPYGPARDAATAGAAAERTRLIECPRAGYIPARRTLVGAARGEVLLSLNDDVVPAARLLDAHRRPHAERADVLITGPSPFKHVPEPTLFDRLVAESPLVFFPPPAPAPGESGLVPVPFRHCFGLNMSARADSVRQVGSFHDLPDTYGYDDIELAFRLQRDAGVTLLFSHDAAVTHDHRLAPDDVLRREYELGRAAWAYARSNPAFTNEVFRRDIRDPEFLRACRAAMDVDRRDAERLERTFCSLAEFPADAASPQLLPAIAELWTTLKRYLWRWGLLDAHAHRPRGWHRLAPTS